MYVCNMLLIFKLYTNYIEIKFKQECNSTHISLVLMGAKVATSNCNKSQKVGVQMGEVQTC
jgi:hypothetical protein